MTNKNCILAIEDRRVEHSYNIYQPYKSARKNRFPTGTYKTHELDIKMRATKPRGNVYDTMLMLAVRGNMRKRKGMKPLTVVVSG